MKVEEIMTRTVYFVGANASIRQAAEIMQGSHCGLLPVGTEKRVLGILTDRDIVIRAVADGKDAEHTKVREIMTKNVYACVYDDELETVADEMRQQCVKRLLVENESGKVVGIISRNQLLVNKGIKKVGDSCLHHLLRKMA
jgi:CBS domain-containing protein